MWAAIILPNLRWLKVANDVGDCLVVAFLHGLIFVCYFGWSFLYNVARFCLKLPVLQQKCFVLQITYSSEVVLVSWACILSKLPCLPVPCFLPHPGSQSY